MGVGLLTAGIILALMITPTMTSIIREIFLNVPALNRQAALALGATDWETMVISVLKASKLGISGAAVLGLGRALGETMAVTMVIGNRIGISSPLFAPSQTMASLIANEYAEASSSLHLSSLAAIGCGLFLVSALINLLTRIFLRKLRR